MSEGKRGRPSTGKWTPEYRREYMRKYREKKEQREYQRKYHYTYLRKPRDGEYNSRRVLDGMWWGMYRDDRSDTQPLDVQLMAMGY